MNIIEETDILYQEVLATSLEEVANKRKISKRWLEERLGLLNLIYILKEKLIDNLMPLSEAYRVSKLSYQNQYEYYKRLYMEL